MTSCAVPLYTNGLYLDRQHPMFDGPRFREEGMQPTLKLIRLSRPNSDDGVTWSVFRTLGRLPGDRWLPALLAAGGIRLTVAEGEDRPPSPALPPMLGAGGMDGVSIEFWPTVEPPASRLLWLLDNLEAPRIAGSRGAGRRPERLQQVRAERA
ncbi:MAG: hypothetical protein NTZ05_21145, partial [Chloroflexi bacterium]|nr:hypothetical protein [Chloroflexota bacterium]